MKIAFNPSTVAALITPPNNKDITFDLRGRNIFARGVKFCGTDTWRDIKINNVSIGSNILDLRNGSNTTLTNTNGVVTINSTWRPVVDNLTSDSTTSSLSANLGRILKALIDGKSNSGHTHDDRYLKLTGGTMTGNIILSRNATITKLLASTSYYSSVVSWSVDGETKKYGREIGLHNLGGSDSTGSIAIVPYKTDTEPWSGTVGLFIAKNTLKLDGKPIAFKSDIPSSLKNPYSLTLLANGITLATYDGSVSKIVNLTYNNVGAAAKNHTHNSLEPWTSHITGDSHATALKSIFDKNKTSIPRNKFISMYSSTYSNGSYYMGYFLLGYENNPYGGFFVAHYDTAYYIGILYGSFAQHRLAYSTDIPNSLKNPYALTISLNGTSQGPYDGSAAKNINITPGSIGAATNDHNHDNRYLKLTGGTMQLGEGLKFHADDNYFGTNSDARIISLLDGNAKVCDGGLIIDERATYKGTEYVTELLRIRDSEFKWRGADILHSGNYSDILDTRYYTESEVNNLLSNKLNTSDFNWTNLPGKLAGNEFNIVNAGFNNRMWFNFLPINDRSKTATISYYCFGNGNGGYASVTASGFVKNGSSSSYVLLGDGGHKTISSLSVNYANSAGNANTLDGIDSTRFLRQVVVPNNTENDFNTFSNMTLTGRVDPTTGASLKNAPWSGSGPAGGYGVLTYLFDGGGYGTQMAWEYGTNRIYIRNRHYSGHPEVGSIWRTSWDKLALTSDNVASATKLQTPRTIWGQSFDGTTDVSGDMTDVGIINTILNLKSKSGKASLYLETVKASTDYAHLFVTNKNDKNNVSRPLILQNGYGNVGIGTNSPAYKLHVAGDIYSTTGFKKNGSSDSYVLLGGGGHKLESSLRVAYASNADMVDGYHVDDILPYGLENLCIGAVASGGQTILNSDGSITTSGNNSDTYFFVRSTENLIAGQIYTVGFYVTGVPSGNTATWSFPFAGQGNNKLVINIKSNGWCWGTGTIPEDIVAGKDIIIDDVERSFYSSINISKFLIVKGKQKAYYTPPISKMSVNHANSAGNADTVDGQHFSYLNSSNSPTYLWATNSDGSSFLAARASISVNYANSANNATNATKLTSSAGSATLPIYFSDGKPVACTASSVFSNLSNSGNNLSITVAGQNRTLTVGYATSAGSTTKVIVNLHTTNDTNYPLVWSNLNNSNTVTENLLFKSWSDLYYNPKNKRLTVGGSVVASSFVKSGGTSLQLLRADGGIATFNWSGQSGLPTWLWGGNNLHSYYVYNPSNFRVAYATSSGNADTLDGVHLSEIFTAFGNNNHNITATIGGTTKSFLVNWAADSDKLDGYHENSFLRYRETTSIDLENTLWDLIGIKLYNGALPDNLTNVYNYGSVISLPCTSTRFEIYASELASLGNGLYYRSGWRDTKRPWLKFIDSSNIGSQSVNYANSAGTADTLDGFHATSGNDKPWGTIPAITTSGWMDIGKQLEFHFDNTTGSDYSTVLHCTGNYSNIVNLPSASGTLALTSEIPTALPANGGNADTTDGVHIKWAGELTSTSHLVAWEADGSALRNINPANISVGYASSAGNADTATNAYHLRINSANTWSTWYWAGLSGLPSWLWGSNDGTNMYVWDPNNFNVNTALYLRSLGNLNCQTGRTLNYGDVYTYNTYDGNTGSPTTFTSVIGFGRGIAGTVEIAGGWDNTNLYWRSLRDCCEDWHSWRTVLDSSNYTEYINNYYWANVKISTSSSTTTSPTVHTLTATRVCAGYNPEIDNSISCSNWFRSSGDTGWYNATYLGGWYMSDTSWVRTHNGVGIYTSGQIYSPSSIRMGNIYLLNTNEINSASGIHLNYRNSGNVSLCYGGGSVGIGTTSPTYKLDVNGDIHSSGTINCNALNVSSTLNVKDSVISCSAGNISILSKESGSLLINSREVLHYDSDFIYMNNRIDLLHGLCFRTSTLDTTYSIYTTDDVTVLIGVLRDNASFKFRPAKDGLLLFLKIGKLYSNTYFWCTAENCVVVRAKDFGIYLDKDQNKDCFGDGLARIFIYTEASNRWYEFYCG